MENRSMGLGPLGNADLVFVRKFRFSLEGWLAKDFKNEEDVWTTEEAKTLDEQWFKNVAIDFVRNRLDFQVMEAIDKSMPDIQIQDWLDRDPHEHEQERLILTTYDGCGEKLYQYEFCGLRIVENYMDFNYAVSDESVRNISVRFDQYVRRCKEKVSGPVKKHYTWKMQVEGGPELTVKLGQRPSLTIQETELNFLNAKTWIPGKASWEAIHVKFPPDHDKTGVVKALLSNECPHIYLHLYTMNEDAKLETWKLFKPLVQKHKEEDGRLSMTLRYDSVEYIHEPIKDWPEIYGWKTPQKHCFSCSGKVHEATVREK